MLLNLKRKAIATMFSVMIASLIAGPAESQVADFSGDYNAETYRVVFQPWADRQIEIRDEQGNLLGKTEKGAEMEIYVNGSIIRQSTTADGIDTRKLLSRIAPRRDASGNIYYVMALPKTYVDENGNSVPYNLRTAEGNLVPGGTRIMLNLTDFYQERAIQPSYASEGERSQPKPIDDFNNTLANTGVTDATRPTTPDTDEPDIALPKTSDDEDDTPDTDYSPANQDGLQTFGLPFPSKFLSSPICSCRSGSCGITSNVGFRRTKRTKNGRRMSHNHQGMDVGAGIGTPVIAAADGCLKIVSKERRCLARTGKTLPISCMREGGYGYTIRLVHGNGYETQYSHLSAISPAIRAGACFKRGDRLGSSGESGNATGPHLHFGVYKAAGPQSPRLRVDPRTVLLGTTASFFSRSCSDQPDNSNLDDRMKASLFGRAVRTGSAAPVRTASRSVR